MCLLSLQGNAPGGGVQEFGGFGGSVRKGPTETAERRAGCHLTVKDFETPLAEFISLTRLALIRLGDLGSRLWYAFYE